MLIFVRLVDMAFVALEYIIFAHIILSWIPQNNHTIRQISAVVESIVSPIFTPLRKIVPVIDLGGVGLDLTAIVALLAISVLRPIVHNLLVMVF